MVALKWLLVILGIGLFGSAAALVGYDVYVAAELRRLLKRKSEQEGGVAGTTYLPLRPFGPVRRQRAAQLAGLSAVLLLSSKCMAVVPYGSAGVRVSQIWGVRPGTYRSLAPNYITREIFAVKREELRSKAAEAIKTQLENDGIMVREVVLRDIKLPEEYAKGLEGLLLKEQENERLGTEQEIKAKEVKIAELEAEAQKARDVKQAEAQPQVTVLQAKAQSDSMQYTLPLKQKQIEQSKLEAEARKEATLQNAEAAAQAKIIDSKAEIERQKNLSDKLQIMMVPVDGKNFFANDVFRSAFNGVPAGGGPGDEEAAGDPGPGANSNLSAQNRNGRKP